MPRSTTAGRVPPYDSGLLATATAESRGSSRKGRGLVDEIEKLVEQKLYMSKGDFVRSAVRKKLLPSGSAPERQPRSE
jgi:hypothetical protein